MGRALVIAADLPLRSDAMWMRFQLRERSVLGLSRESVGVVDSQRVAASSGTFGVCERLVNGTAGPLRLPQVAL
jgi:hypothetical protein